MSILEKYTNNRKCKENTFCRDEIYDIYKCLGDSNANRKADEIFFKTN